MVSKETIFYVKLLDSEVNEYKICLNFSVSFTVRSTVSLYEYIIAF